MKWLMTIGIVFAAGMLTLAFLWTPPPDSGDTLWTCPMHPEIRLPDPGPCPKCEMDLVPYDDEDLGPRRTALSHEVARLAGIETSPVTRQFVTIPVRMVGKLEYDETRVRTIAARVTGWVDRLFVDYTGVSVKEGDHLFWLYSPDLLQAQQELLIAKSSLDSGMDTTGRNLLNYQAARAKLLLWDLDEDQVDEIEARGTAENHVTIRSPTGGVVIHKAFNEGDEVQSGEPIYRIADLSSLWVMLDAYEQDLPWLRYGQSISMQIEGVPGETFEGRISFIDPLVDEQTRTVKLRVHTDNPQGRLKRGMFVRAVVQSQVAGGGKVMEPALEGKWICPMHPEVVKDAPGLCDACEMDLVSSADLDYVSDAETEKPLVVPASAVLVTGTRAVVYVEVADDQKRVYEGREIVLGPRAGDLYIVAQGLAEGDRVVTQGAFRVDSSMQIKTKPSMISTKIDHLGTTEFRASLAPVYTAYLGMQEALAGDDPAGASVAGGVLLEALDRVQAAPLLEDAQIRWGKESVILLREATSIRDATSIGTLRERFEPLSESVLRVEESFGHAGSEVLFKMHCPMAFDDKGANWLQRGEEIFNPYFGSEMLSCGVVKANFFGIEKLPEDAPVPDPRLAPEKGNLALETEVEAVEAGGFDGTQIFDAYFALQSALAGDNYLSAVQAIAQLHETVQVSPPDNSEAGLGEAWTTLRDAVAAGFRTRSISTLRRQFEPISHGVLDLHDAVGHAGPDAFYVMHCPMAFGNRGADWLQRKEELLNPYFGAIMLHCGSVTDVLEGKN